MKLSTPLTDAGRVYKMYSGRLQKLRIQILEDFLYHLPTRYEDFSLLSKIGMVQEGETVTVTGSVLEIKNEFARNYKKLQKATIIDETGSAQILWFNQPYLTQYIRKNDHIAISGRAEKKGNKITFVSPDYEVLQNGSDTSFIHTGRLVPVYPETRGISSKWLRRQTYKLLNEIKDMQDFLPGPLKQKYGYYDLAEALYQAHFPVSITTSQKARERLAFDELFLLQLASLKRKKDWEKNLHGSAFRISEHKEKIEKFWKALPFTLTEAQKKAVTEIFKDLSDTKPMNRLLQGDVGSGKTVVATIAMYISYLNGYQSVLMAPTEILAQQHYATIERLLAPMGVTIALATGTKKHETAKFDILVGTHAVLSEKVVFNRLALVVIDEQQRFGVQQRGIIRQKGNNPHLLTMTATPIPRTVALTLYGDLDLSYLDEMPKGRKLVKTWLVPPEKRDGAYDWIRKEIRNTDSQAFIICPFIEESESMTTVRAANKEYERLKHDVFPDLNVGLLHGKMKAKEKDTALKDFRNRSYDILVATPVVEVGIDIPNATIIMIEASDRFGLAQLHQLRGRVGRGDKQSYCLLFTEAKTEKTITRLKAMGNTYVGAELAELDLKLRGPGELYGTLQSGVPNLKVASFSDFPLIERARIEAEHYFPKIQEHPTLAEKLDSVALKIVSPD